MPEVTVLIPVKNGGETIRRCLDSVLRQNFSDIQVLVVDDGSTDSTSKVVNSLSDPRLRYVSIANSDGLGCVLNYGLSLIDTPFIARMDADDIMVQGRIAEQVAFLKANPKYGIVGGQIIFFVGNKSLPGPDFPCDNDSILKDLFQQRFSVCHPAVLVRRDVFDAVGGYHVPGPGQDLDFFIRASQFTKLANIPVLVHRMQLDLGSYSSSKARDRLLAYRYATFAFKRRVSRGQDIEFAEYAEKFSRQYRLRIQSILFAAFNRCYRKYLIFNIQGNRIKYLFLILSISLRPVFSVRVISSKLKAKLNLDL